MIYLDNASTSFPKPEIVTQEMMNFMTNIGASVNRTVSKGAQSVEETTLDLREKLCSIFNFDKYNHVILTSGATMSLNTVINGYLKHGGHAICSSLEHNSVTRPLNALSENGVTFDKIYCDESGYTNPQDVLSLIKENTKMLILCHASNVSGTVQNAEEIGKICKEKKIAFVLDASQSVGHVDIDFKKLNLSALAFSAHKGLMGPAGIGALLLSEDFAQKVSPLVFGGTGSASNLESQPSYMPDKFESGTPNLPGIFGFNAALDFFMQHKEEIFSHDKELLKLFLDGISDIKNIRVLGGCEIKKDPLFKRVGVVSIDFKGLDNSAASFMLEKDYGIITRCGLHCSPSAHKTFNTLKSGAVRFSFGFYNTKTDVQKAVLAIKKIAESGGL